MSRVLQVARSWVGVPYLHQGRTRHGCDCGGLIGGVAIECGVIPSTWWETVFDPIHGGYARTPSNGQLEAICDSFMLPADTLQPGDVLLMRFKREPQHLAFVGDYPGGGNTLIHALDSVKFVTEHRMDPQWCKRIVACYRMPEVKL